MGYSEIVCHICGVSFTIGRYRTPEEVFNTNPDVPEGDDEFLAQYILNARTGYCWECDNEEEGDCLVHIPPKKETWPKPDHRFQFGSNTQGGDENAAESNEEADAVVDEDFTDSPSEISEPYEYQSPNEDEPESSDVDMPDADVPIDSRLWERELNDKPTTGTLRPFVSSRVRDRERRAQGLEEEYPADGGDDHLEHIPGKQCTGKQGYCGSRISLAEMRGCTVAQALVSRPLDPEDWQPESDDESFEGDSNVGFFLSGVTDHVPSRDVDDPNFYPERHGVTKAPACNYSRDIYMDDDDRGAHDAMPFHPTCLEVFKRASLWRTGRVDMKGLVEWFKLEGTFDKSGGNIPRSPAVGRAGDQWWKHVKGDEHIVANPCYVPTWDQAIASGAVVAKSGEGAMQGVFDLGDQVAPQPSDEAKDLFSRFNEGIRLCILTHLGPDPKDIANLRLASRAFRQLPRQLFWDLVLQRRPWLWEAWCDLPYSRWTVRGAGALKRMDDAWREREEMLQHSIEVLEQEAEGDFDNAAAIKALVVQLEQIVAEKREARAEVPVPLLPSDTTDWHTIYKWLARPKPTWPKGLRNRRRIWVDCGYILERIEVNRREGKIAALKEETKG
ncbi:hypothetical protein B0T11DRAFT_269860 [Plectosphaerella cucumerina]|uniref:F-box domain-containing protein n=1 Tax=Plectosphaerella cucumerina TaxID=40658 RepID=A0A8K0TMS8_9PEZI|nr:hypothetical protein B0T11DRAFT_269860 [Plectosphaerella cucumerina]